MDEFKETINGASDTDKQDFIDYVHKALHENDQDALFSILEEALTKLKEHKVIKDEVLFAKLQTDPERSKKIINNTLKTYDEAIKDYDQDKTNDTFVIEASKLYQCFIDHINIIYTVLDKYIDTPEYKAALTAYEIAKKAMDDVKKPFETKQKERLKLKDELNTSLQKTLNVLKFGSSSTSL